jgi:hypothetical protein
VVAVAHPMRRSDEHRMRSAANERPINFVSAVTLGGFKSKLATPTISTNGSAKLSPYSWHKTPRIAVARRRLYRLADDPRLQPK